MKPALARQILRLRARRAEAVAAIASLEGRADRAADPFVALARQVIEAADAVERALRKSPSRRYTGRKER